MENTKHIFVTKSSQSFLSLINSQIDCHFLNFVLFVIYVSFERIIEIDIIGNCIDFKNVRLNQFSFVQFVRRFNFTQEMAYVIF